MCQQCRAGDRQAAVRALAEQRGQLVARQGNLLVDLFQLGLRCGHIGARLRGLDLRIQTSTHALACEVGQVLALVDGTLGHVALRIQRGELGVGAGHGRGEHQPGGLAFGLDCLVVRQRGFQCGAVLAPEVQVVAHAQLDLRFSEPVAAQRRTFKQIV